MIFFTPDDQTILLATVITAGLAFLAAVLTPIITWWLKQKESRKDLVKDALSEQLNISNKLQILLEETKADRVSIFQFHNGDKFFASHTHIKKVSTSFEVCAPGIAHIITQMQSIPITEFIVMIKTIYDSGIKIVPDVNANFGEHYNDTFTLGQISKGVNSSYLFAIRNLNKSRLIGILSVEYIKKIHDMSSEDIVNCKLTSDKLSGYIAE